MESDTGSEIEAEQKDEEDVYTEGLSAEEMRVLLLAERRRLLAERRRRIEEKRRRIEERIESEALADGSFFAPLEHVWGKQGIVCTRENGVFFSHLRRDPTHLPKIRVRNNAYTLTTACANARTSIAADDGSSARSGVDRDAIWSKDIFGLKASGAQVAHLVPAAPDDASSYWSVAICVFGLDSDPLVQPSPMKTVQKLIHGSKGEDTRRVNHTGLKHFVCNKIRLKLQETHFDTYARLLIVPVMTLADMKLWDGRKYNAIVLAQSSKDVSAATVYTDIGMTNRGRDATRHEVDTARDSLEHLILGFTYSLHFNNRDEELSDKTRNKIVKLRRTFGWALDGTRVLVPKRLDLDTSRTHVRLIQFDAFDCTNGHPAPDPLLLGAKAALNFAKQNNQGMFAAADPLELEESRDELSLAAEAQYLEDRRQFLEEKRDREIMNLVINVRTDSAISS
jgi:hypothetical protein